VRSNCRRGSSASALPEWDAPAVVTRAYAPFDRVRIRPFAPRGKAISPCLRAGRLQPRLGSNRLRQRLPVQRGRLGNPGVNIDIEADFTLFTTCNYGCDYCFFPEEALRRKLPKIASPEEWGQAFDRTGLTWLVHLTGGEPTVLPTFVELCERLTQRHYLSLNTNLSRPNIGQFVERIDPARVAYINAALHPLEREKRNGFAIFLDNMILLRDRGFTVYASVVATPEALRALGPYRARLNAAGFGVVPKLLRGPHNNQTYPAAYTDADKALFREAAQAARAEYAALLAGMPFRPTIDPFYDDEYLEGLPQYQGRNCQSGEKFVLLRNNGAVGSCARPGLEFLGNLLQGTFRRKNGMTRCQHRFCFYNCEKYAEGGRNFQPTPRAPGVGVRQVHFANF
jgi:MoaA/NifB/PqqE/SkfB family radical SAM enzyme